MLDLSAIQDTVMNVAQAITAALEIETEIISDSLEIIGGTGRYQQKIGRFEENGDLNSGDIYGKLLQTGDQYLCTDPEADPDYKPLEGELAEICCPIQLNERVIGLISLVAFTADQRIKILENSKTLALFLQRMADLLASKLSETEKADQLTGILESMHEGLLAIDRNGTVISCNNRSARLLSLDRSQMENKKLSDFWEMKEAENVMQSGESIKDKELHRKLEDGITKQYLCTIVPIAQHASIDSGSVASSTAHGAMILFQDVTDARERIFKMTSNENNTTFSDIIGDSDAILRIKQRTLQVSSSDSTVLITGESGTGKELFARSIHSASPRWENPFISINCGAIPEMLLESELFGYEKGAFTGAATSGKPGKFEMAHKGTIFLDEIGDLPLHLQVKLLHAIQNRRIDRVGGLSPINIDVRIIAATNKNLEEMIQEKAFREDLFFRLNVIPVTIPPLRERGGDVELLLYYALRKFTKLLNKKLDYFHPLALEALLAYPWPGNVRELENVIEYAINMETSDQIRLDNLPDKIRRKSLSQSGFAESLKSRLDDLQRAMIVECLKQTGNSTQGKRKAARILGFSETTLYRRIRELRI